jgi:acyl-coenzyme A thioesterase PaaI-like protein
MATLDYAALAAGYGQAIPFATFVGLDVREIGPGSCIVVLPEGEDTMNHVRSQHAGALFTLGESASGGAFIGAFAERMGEITPLAESAEIAYRKIARGDITARGSFVGDAASILDELDREGRVRFPIEVELTDADGTVVCELTVRWYVRRNAPA